MGGSLLKSDGIEARIQYQYRSIRRYMDEIYGDITILQNNQSKEMFCLLKRVTSDIGFQANIEKWKYNQNPLYLQLRNCQSQSLQLCSRTKKYYILVEHYQKSLEKQISFRQYQNKDFTKQQLINLLINLISVVISLRFEKQRIPYLSSKIFFLSSEGSLKILPTFLMTYDESSDSLVIGNSRLSRQIVAPEVSKIIFKPEEANSKNLKQPSIVYQLGMIMLQASTLLDSFQIFIDNTPNQNYIEERLDRVNNNYGSQLEAVLRRMINENPNNRPSLQQIKRIFKKQCVGSRYSSSVIQEPRMVRQIQGISNHHYL